jgi:hypothetical protein
VGAAATSEFVISLVKASAVHRCFCRWSSGTPYRVEEVVTAPDHIGGEVELPRCYRISDRWLDESRPRTTPRPVDVAGECLERYGDRRPSPVRNSTSACRRFPHGHADPLENPRRANVAQVAGRLDTVQSRCLEGGVRSMMRICLPSEPGAALAGSSTTFSILSGAPSMVRAGTKS